MLISNINVFIFHKHSFYDFDLFPNPKRSPG